MLKMLIGLMFAGAVYFSANVINGLPDTENIHELKMMSATQVYDKNGELISKLFEQNRVVVSSANMSPYLAKAIVANEDTRFYQHIGIDPIGIGRAIWVNLTTGSISEGGSTITQQLAREMFLNQERTIERKAKEAILALIIDFRFSKAEILQAYLNQVYLGEGAYGVEAASQKYFGKGAAELDLAESAMIAGLARGPVLYSPFRDEQTALNRRAIVLDNMYAQQMIDTQELEQAKKAPFHLAKRQERAVKASYFIDYAAKQLVDKFGDEAVYQHGLRVYTTLDSNIQQAAEKILDGQQGAVIALEPESGEIRAMVGGNNYEVSTLNRAVDELRQPGSAFKPFIYAAAIQKGYKSNDIFNDEPVNIAGYKPQNYDKQYMGNMTLKKALRWSINTVAVKLAYEVGIDDALEMAEAAGISSLSSDDKNLAAALGGLTNGVNLLELTAAYAMFANHGIYSQPTAILRVEDEFGHILYDHHRTQKAVIDENTAYIMTDMLQGVILNGTASNASIGRDAAGKTGTSDKYESAWFIGYTPQLLAGIYLGNDDRSSMSLSGTQAAGYWQKFMLAALKDSKPEEFAVPKDIVRNVKIDAKTGRIASGFSKDFEYSAFINGTEPKALFNKEKPAKKAEKPAKQKNWWEKLPGLLGL